MLQQGYYVEYSDREIAARGTSIIHSEKIKDVSDKIRNEWVRLDFSQDGIHRTDYFLSPYSLESFGLNLWFAAITKRQIEPDKYEDRIKFVAKREQGLIDLATEIFDLPFDRKKIFPTFDFPNK